MDSKTATERLSSLSDQELMQLAFVPWSYSNSGYASSNPYVDEDGFPISSGEDKEPPDREMSEVIAHSHLIDKEIKLQWEGDDPQEVIVNGVPFTLEEIKKLKSLPPSDLKAALETKLMFEGEIS